MKLIPLSQTRKRKYCKLKLFAMVDDEDYEYLNQWKWCVAKGRYTYYAKRAGSRKETIFMHRQILKLEGKILCDHIDRDGLNNQKLNLRMATYSENQKNKKGKGVSGYLGVHFIKKSNKWAAFIQIDNKQKRLGVFENKTDAALAYDNAAIIYHKEFSNINFK